MEENQLNRSTRLYVTIQCWASLLTGLFFQILAIIAGFARDIRRQDGEFHA